MRLTEVPAERTGATEPLLRLTGERHNMRRLRAGVAFARFHLLELSSLGVRGDYEPEDLSSALRQLNSRTVVPDQADNVPDRLRQETTTLTVNEVGVLRAVAVAMVNRAAAAEHLALALSDEDPKSSVPIGPSSPALRAWRHIENGLTHQV